MSIFQENYAGNWQKSRRGLKSWGLLIDEIVKKIVLYTEIDIKKKKNNSIKSF